MSNLPRHASQHHPTRRAARAHRYPGIKPAQTTVPNRHDFLKLPSRYPYAVPELDQRRQPVDHAAQRQRISRYAAARSAARLGSADHLARATHQINVDDNRSCTRPVAPQRGTAAVIRKEVERLRAAKGLPPPRRICNRPCT